MTDPIKHWSVDGPNEELPRGEKCGFGMGISADGLFYLAGWSDYVTDGIQLTLNKEQADSLLTFLKDAAK